MVSVYQVPRDPVTGLPQPAEAVMGELEQHGYQRPAVAKYLTSNECNYVTTR